jgi:hypothetical protein
MEFDKELGEKSFEKSLDEREFYTVGYMKSLGIMVFTLITLILSFGYMFYGSFIYEPPVSYLALNAEKRMLEEKLLTELHIETKELEQWTNDAVLDITSWNYLSYDTHGISVDKYFDSAETPKFMEKFNALFLQKMVRSQKAIVIPEILSVFKVSKNVKWKGKAAFIIKGSVLLKIFGKDSVKTIKYYITVAVARESFAIKQDGLSILKIDLNTEKVD